MGYKFDEVAANIQQKKATRQIKSKKFDKSLFWVGVKGLNLL